MSAGSRWGMLGLAALAGLAVLAVGAPGRAGDRPIQVVVSNMTPDAASSEASKRCVQTLRERMTADHSDLYPIGETPLRALVGHPAKSESFLVWTRDELTRVLDSAKAPGLPPALQQRDAFVAIDCRPEEKKLDVLFLNSARQRGVLRVRSLPLGRPRVLWVGDELMHQLWTGFSP